MRISAYRGGPQTAIMLATAQTVVKDDHTCDEWVRSGFERTQTAPYNECCTAKPTEGSLQGSRPHQKGTNSI
jgi:hypothetical protein